MFLDCNTKAPLFTVITMMLRYIVATLLIEYVSSASVFVPENNITEALVTSIFNPCTKGECFVYYQCDNNGTVITTGKGLVDLRLGGDEDDDSPCKTSLRTCCTSKLENPKIPENPPYNGCGYRNVNGVGFHVVGDRHNESQFGEFPWSVAIYNDDLFQCGGSLISPSVVLTVAHCVSGKIPKSLKIRAGEWDIQTNDEIFPHQDRYVSEMIIHEQFEKDSGSNDIALLFLEKPVEMAAHVNTVCLPPLDYVFDGSKCFATGWGKDIFGQSGKFQVILKRKELPIVPRVPCQKAFRETRLGPAFELHESLICAGGELGIDMCEGDGGSPLVCLVPGKVDRFYQAGIVAWGIGCGEAIPGAYVNVALFRNWIDAKMLDKQRDKTSYLLESKNVDFRTL